jgi:hypothetical protein
MRMKLPMRGGTDEHFLWLSKHVDLIGMSHDAFSKQYCVHTPGPQYARRTDLTAHKALVRERDIDLDSARFVTCSKP